MQLISAQGAQSSAAALGVLEGTLSREIAAVSERLKSACAALAAWVDYPDEEIDDLSDASLAETINFSVETLKNLMSRFDSGRAVLAGVDTAIVGKPNVGKSTLMNRFVGAEKSIVTDIAGTTRDVVEETVTVGNVVLRLSDTAGLRETGDAVEKIGVERARRKVENAVLVLAVFDGSAPLTEEDRALISLCTDKKAIAVVNKSDKNRVLDNKILDTSFDKVIFISAKENKGMADLESAVEETLGTADFDPSAATLMNERQFACCSAALDSLLEAKSALECGMTRDAIEVSMDAAIESLDILTGRRATESVVDEIFSQFCVGK